MTTTTLSSRYFDYLYQYAFVATFLADIHLDGSPLLFHGEEIPPDEYFHRLLGPLADTSMLGLIGDIQDRTPPKDVSGTKKQWHFLVSTLEEYDLLDKTVVLPGNHDAHARYFQWRHPLLVRPSLRLHLLPFHDVVIHHGDNLGLDPLMKKVVIEDTDVREWRTTLKRQVGGQWIRQQDIVIVGHTHRGYCDRKEFTLAVPSVRKILTHASNRHLGYVGMFCFSLEKDPWDWNIAIERPGF